MKRKEAQEKGLTYYFTGKPCKNGHTAKRLTSCGNCYECMKEHIKSSLRAKAWKKDWEKKNPEKVKAHRKTFIENHRGYKNSLTASRRVGKLQRTPKWLTDDDKFLIKEAYELAQLRSKLFGFTWHVDHKLPLKGDTVSGLHIIENLQVIPAKDNLKKSNNYNLEVKF